MGALARAWLDCDSVVVASKWLPISSLISFMLTSACPPLDENLAVVTALSFMPSLKKGIRTVRLLLAKSQEKNRRWSSVCGIS